MATHTPDVYSGNLRTDNTDEIDLRRYALIIISWWREILFVSLLSGGITGIGLALIDNNRIPVYQASADIIIARFISNIELDDRVSMTNATAQGDAGGWRASLLQLVQSSVVAEAVLAELGDALPPGLQTVHGLLNTISAEVPLSNDGRVPSNMIRVSSVTGSPELSAQIATSWSRHLVNYINGLYGEVPETMLQSVTLEREQTFTTYQRAEKAYEEFVANNQIAVLERQINEKTMLRSELMANYTRMITSVVSADYNARLELNNTLANARSDHAKAVIAAQSDGNILALNQLYGLRSLAMAQLNQARNMERSLLDGGEAAAKSNVPALQVLKLAAFASLQADDRLPANLSISNSGQSIEMSLDEQLIDVQALVTVFEEYLSSLDKDINALAEAEVAATAMSALTGAESQRDDQTEQVGTTTYTNTAAAYAQLILVSGMLDASSSTTVPAINDAHETLLTQLEGEIRTLHSAMTAEQARQQQLIHQRDLAWTTYEAVGNKLQELNLLRSSANSEVRLGNPALPPTSSLDEDSPLMMIVALTAAGFFLTIVVALLVDSLGGGPFFARRPS